MAVLLLRGPQTAGELRARTERMAQFDGIDAVDADLVRLSEKAGAARRSDCRAGPARRRSAGPSC